MFQYKIKERETSLHWECHWKPRGEECALIGERPQLHVCQQLIVSTRTWQFERLTLVPKHLPSPFIENLTSDHCLWTISGHYLLRPPRYWSSVHSSILFLLHIQTHRISRSYSVHNCIRVILFDAAQDSPSLPSSAVSHHTQANQDGTAIHLALRELKKEWSSGEREYRATATGGIV